MGGALNRRAFLTGGLRVATAAPLAVLPTVALTERDERFGRVDVGHPAFPHARAFLNGEDVSRRCCEADDKAGYVDLYDEPLTGVVHRYYGDVRIELRVAS